MRFSGTLKTWNDERGFGFIAPDEGGQDIFIHATDLPHGHRRPSLGEPLSFEVALNRDGKKKAVQVRAGPATAAGTDRQRACPHPVREGRSRSWAGSVIALLLFATLAGIGWKTLQGYRHRAELRTQPASTQPEVRAGVQTIAPNAVQAGIPRAGDSVRTPLANAPKPPANVPAPAVSAGSAAGFRCDGRTRCSQMRSCAEATFFINSCPGTKMDGNGDGVPCEQQWCRP